MWSKPSFFIEQSKDEKTQDLQQCVLHSRLSLSVSFKLHPGLFLLDAFTGL